MFELLGLRPRGGAPLLPLLQLLLPLPSRSKRLVSAAQLATT